MPEIERFGAFKLLMFFQDENPPHVHIKGADALQRFVSRTATCSQAMRRTRS